MEVQIKEWKAVAAWTWGMDEDDVCGICRHSYDSPCPACNMPGEDCPPMWGECNHVFHMHCILKWLQAQNQDANCPMCRRPWAFKEG
mmetsp:Transcript_50106/g.128965  ORF Transcript_50106/g.128965 Transcript_50106/m.128965 type:complete len:87 (+) Transcript_50106:125-385(+)|eukprot:CAMPEP_0113891922 /NCGR_PEP_ID=MMETSP0780_2-20120614/15071_1 /TAXON_ID=652834 /ORGANISM="Palpitomonas bilix" /LENGTH=86 /DNA_ID=CAMNT_0000881685 /DNA_START=68 /DNA_END=328 /DNA_ORIENTATION=+ /assembly_acc=CAM_ASM_000599